MNLENAPKDSLPEPIMRNSFCAFADILGFKDLVMKSIAEGSSGQVLRELHAIISRQIERMQPVNQLGLGWVKSFTDNVVLGFPLEGDGESQFGLLIESLTVFQYEMAKKGFFLRGGVATGPLFMDENVAFGAALLEAYDIEQRVAVYPRIVLSKEAVLLISSHLKYYAPNVAPHHSVVSYSGQTVFTNYLCACHDEASDKVDEQGLLDHKESVLNKIGSCKKPSVKRG